MLIAVSVEPGYYRVQGSRPPSTRKTSGHAVGGGLTLPEAPDRIRALAARWPESTTQP